MDFEEFKKEAINNSNTLKSEKLSVLLAKKRADFSQSIQNPTVEVEESRFDDERGWRVALSQPIRFLGVKSDLNSLNSAKIEEAKANFLLTKALYKKNLEILYSEYVYEKGLQTLINRELKLANHLESITKQRFKNGVGTKAKLMMATLEKEDIKNRLLAQKDITLKKFLNLLRFANLENIEDLDANFIYDFSTATKESNSSNPSMIKLEKQRQRTLLKSKSLNHAIKSFDLFGEYEDEPDGDIGRVGVALAIPLFKQNSKEAELAQIESTKISLIQKSKEIEQKVQTRYLKSSILNLKQQYLSLKEQQNREQQLLKLFEEGYKISKGSLLELIEVKNRLIQTRQRTLLVQKEANIKQIELNFIEGRYND
jgi:outer membrane protein TolC